MASPSLRMARRADEIARRRADVLAAAASIFAVKGYHDTQVTDIADAAELSRASLYALFEGKEELYREVVSSAAEAIRDTVRDCVDGIDDPAEQLMGVIGSLLSCWEKDETLLQLYHLGAHGIPLRIRKEMGESTVRLFVDFTDWVVSLAENAQRAGYLRGQDAEAVAVAVVGAVTTHATRWLESKREFPLSDAAATLVTVFRPVVGCRGSGEDDR